MVSIYLSTSSYAPERRLTFKEIHLDCHVPTIMREFPQNAVTPTTQDLEQNTCPIWANACHLNNAINRAIMKSVTDTLSSSCRYLVCLSMCNAENIIPSDPLSWNKDCVNGVCKSCPKNLPIKVTPDLRKVEIKFSQWCYEKKIIRTEKNGKVVPIEKTVFSLYPHSSNVKEALAMLENMCRQLRKHIYEEYMQWNAHVQARENLNCETFTSIEDYQMSMEVM